MSGLRRARWDDLTAPLAYALLKLRVDVFVVEQQCPYPDLDGRDLDAATEHVWFTDERGEHVAYLRVLHEPDGSRRIGRVVTSPAARGRGLAGTLMDDTVARHGAGVLVLNAQSPLAGWYARWGFVVSGEEFVEDGIPHVPMRRDPARSSSG